MKNSDVFIRSARWEDRTEIKILHRKVAAQGGGIIHTSSEITDEYIDSFMEESMRNGIILVMENPLHAGIIWAEVHAYKYPVKAFDHILGDLTIVVHPLRQGKGLGKELIRHFLNKIKNSYPNILRVELFVRENNLTSVKFYQKVGFKKEGKFINRIKNQDGSFETPLPMVWLNSNYQG